MVEGPAAAILVLACEKGLESGIRQGFFVVLVYLQGRPLLVDLIADLRYRALDGLMLARFFTVGFAQQERVFIEFFLFIPNDRRAFVARYQRVVRATLDVGGHRRAAHHRAHGQGKQDDGGEPGGAW